VQLEERFGTSLDFARESLRDGLWVEHAAELDALLIALVALPYAECESGAFDVSTKDALGIEFTENSNCNIEHQVDGVARFRGVIVRIRPCAPQAVGLGEESGTLCVKR
jgi:hypothetical protein